MSAPRRGVVPGFIEGELECRIGKRCYFGAQEAESMRDRMSRQSGKPLRVYWCRLCGFRHLTSQPFKEDGES